MSLDVCLNAAAVVEAVCPHCGGAVRAEAPGREVYSSNITHNLNRMADAAGIYEACWRPEEKFADPRARDLIPLLEAGLARLKADPAHFRQFDASNGWGTYEHFVPWLEEYLQACRENPDARVEASR